MVVFANLNGSVIQAIKGSDNSYRQNY